MYTKLLQEKSENFSFYAEIGLSIFLWYAASAVANTTSRKFLTQGPALPVEMTLVQFFFASMFGFMVLHILKLREYKPISADAVKQICKLTFVYTMGFLFVNAGYLMVNVSLAETLRATEPLITVMLAVVVLKTEPVSALEGYSMIPIVLGGILSSMGDGSFTATGLVYVGISNFCFSLRSMFTKQLGAVYTGDAINIFYHVSCLGAALLASVVVMKETFLFVAINATQHHSFEKYSILNSENIEAFTSAEVVSLLCVNGLGYVAYNQTSFYVLSRVRMVTHGVANAFRRVVTILFSVWYFGNEINPQNAIGISMAVLGVVLYTKAKDFQTAKVNTIV